MLLLLLLRVVCSRGELKLTTLKLATTRNRWWFAQNKSSTYEGRGGGGKHQQQHREESPTVFQVDTVFGPGCDTSQASGQCMSDDLDCGDRATSSCITAVAAMMSCEVKRG